VNSFFAREVAVISVLRFVPRALERRKNSFKKIIGEK
jgi:hypothetical protein